MDPLTIHPGPESVLELTKKHTTQETEDLANEVTYKPGESWTPFPSIPWRIDAVLDTEPMLLQGQ